MEDERLIQYAKMHSYFRSFTNRLIPELRKFQEGKIDQLLSRIRQEHEVISNLAQKIGTYFPSWEDWANQYLKGVGVSSIEIKYIMAQLKPCSEPQQTLNVAIQYLNYHGPLFMRLNSDTTNK